MATKKTVKLRYTGSVSAKYMLENGSQARVYPGNEVDTPECFVKQRLSERCWERVKDKKPLTEEKEVKTDGK